MRVFEAGRRYTYSDYAGWDDDARYELIDGAAYLMSPGPSSAHQCIGGNLHIRLADFLKGKPCKVFFAPFDVRLDADSGDYTVVQPDLLVVCDKSKIDGRSCVGAPDLMIEILSPSTSSRDRVLKFNKYLKAGVREYWIVDPVDKVVSVYVLKDGGYVANVYSDADVIPASVLEGCRISVEEVFDDIWAD